ncbi:MAG: MaoC/PaaZ C-terminal domain-containing protein [Sciscionella sp.]
MALDTSIAGTELPSWRRTWTADEALLYAVAVGAGQHDPTEELALTTENTQGVRHKALGSFGIVLAQFGGPPAHHLDGVDFTQLLHAQQSITLHRPLPTSGSVDVASTVTDLFDKGSGALVLTRTDATDAGTGEAVFTTRSGVFLRGEGGFGGDRGPSEPSPIPEDGPTRSVRFATTVNQALLYRLTGDRNPLHSDPAFAAKGGFDRPILHGLATFGITTRLLVNACAAGDPDALAHIEGRFTKPVYPGDELVVDIWALEEGYAFRTSNAAGEVVLDRGRLQVR